MLQYSALLNTLQFRRSFQRLDTSMWSNSLRVTPSLENQVRRRVRGRWNHEPPINRL